MGFKRKKQADKANTDNAFQHVTKVAEKPHYWPENLFFDPDCKTNKLSKHGPFEDHIRFAVSHINKATFRNKMSRKAVIEDAISEFFDEYAAEMINTDRGIPDIEELFPESVPRMKPYEERDKDKPARNIIWPEGVPFYPDLMMPYKYLSYNNTFRDDVAFKFEHLCRYTNEPAIPRRGRSPKKVNIKSDIIASAILHFFKNHSHEIMEE